MGGLFQASTIKKNNKILSNGGRVLNATVLSSSLSKARKIALDILNKIKFKNKYFRKDIGYKVIDR